MKKRSHIIAFFLFCSVVIAAALHAGHTDHKDCRECNFAIRKRPDSIKLASSAAKEYGIILSGNR